MWSQEEQGREEETRKAETIMQEMNYFNNYTLTESSGDVADQKKLSSYATTEKIIFEGKA